MKPLLAVLILGGALAAGPAVAGSYGGGFYAQDKNNGVTYPKGQGKRYERVERPQRYVPSGPPGRGAPGHMTDDERRQLHRDLDKANRELYRGRRDR
jgi:hypothetical protein